MDKKDLKPIEVNNTHDIRKAISPFIKEIKAGKVDIVGDVEWTDESGNKHKSSVKSYSSDVNIRQNLIDGFDQVKEQMRMWHDLHDVLQEDEYGASLPEPDIDDIYMPVDRIIKYRLGGKREGMTIVWTLSDRKVVFDPYAKSLEEIVVETP